MREGKKEKSLFCDLVGFRFFLLNPYANYLFQKSLTEGVITNLDSSMHLDSHICISVWLWLDVQHHIYLLWQSALGRHRCYCQWAGTWGCMQIFSRGKAGEGPGHSVSCTAPIRRCPAALWPSCRLSRPCRNKRISFGSKVFSCSHWNGINDSIVGLLLPPVKNMQVVHG